jgi:hypothetical protein
MKVELLGEKKKNSPEWVHQHKVIGQDALRN